MSRRWLVRLYPRAWRARYGDEFEALLEEIPMTPARWFDTIRQSVLERWGTGRHHGWLAGAVLVVLAPPSLVVALSGEPTLAAWWSVESYWLLLLVVAAVALAPWAVVSGARHRGLALAAGLSIAWRVLSHLLSGLPVLLALVLTACVLHRALAVRPASIRPD